MVGLENINVDSTLKKQPRQHQRQEAERPKSQPQSSIGAATYPAKPLHGAAAPLQPAFRVDPMDRSEPVMVKVWRKNGLLKAGSAKIYLYSFNYGQLHSLRDKLESILGCHSLTFKSMKGLKDFKIFSAENPDKKSEWKLFHIQHAPLGERDLSDCITQNPQKGYEHMIAAIAGTPLDEALQTLAFPQGSKIMPQATATLLYSGLDLSFFIFVLFLREA